MNDPKSPKSLSPHDYKSQITSSITSYFESCFEQSEDGGEEEGDLEEEWRGVSEEESEGIGGKDRGVKKRTKKEEEKRLESQEETKENYKYIEECKEEYKEEYKNECFIVEKVQEKELKTPSKNLKVKRNKTKILTLRLADSKISTRKFILILSDSWFWNIIKPQSQVQVIGSFNDVNNFKLTLGSSRIIQEENAEFIILEPKIMISVTILTKYHEERGYRSMYIPSNNLQMDPEPYNVPEVYGKIIHLIFSDLLNTKIHTKATLDQSISQAIERYHNSLYYENEEVDKVINNLTKAIKATLDWIKIFSRKSSKYNKYKLKLIGQIGSELEIYSTKFGLKGKIDSVCEFEDYAMRKVVHAVELKTGVFKKRRYKNQVLLYSLLLRETFSNAGKNNLLVYSRDKQNTQMVYWSHRNLSNLIQQRNNFVSKNLSQNKIRTLRIQNFNRTEILDTGYSLFKCKPKGNGFILALYKDITQELKSSNFHPILPLGSKTTIRPTGSEIVFNMGTLSKIHYIITNPATESTHNPKILLQPPLLTTNDRCQIRYFITYSSHPHMNTELAGVKRRWGTPHPQEWLYQFEKHFYPSICISPP
ncbi:unnamed protein product [Moneuplotes crassus]|uniref:DNA replication factor Dna2 N-terminal domain-containing protein n=1 Tax=Euplotes crassus TaxID=5936 RepID=A0AAD1U518_EUPCR|nr:unnamed protein product [Moneuplotes crassus]